MLRHSLMERMGPCSHCGIGYLDPVWHNGSAEKPVLCKACSSDYNLKGNLEKDVEVQPQDIQENVDSGTNVGTPNNDVPSSDTAASSVMVSEENPGSLWNGPIPTKKRSPGDTGRMAEVGWFKNQLINLQNCYAFYSDHETSEDDVLVYAPNKYIPENEIGLGCVLLNPDYTVKKLDDLSRDNKITE